MAKANSNFTLHNFQRVTLYVFTASLHDPIFGIKCLAVQRLRSYGSQPLSKKLVTACQALLAFPRYLHH